jgi:hypothetical protein
MRWGVAVVKAIWALFVDDAAFVAMAIVWLALMVLLATTGLHSRWDGVLLFCGLGMILVYGALRRTRSR